MVDTAPAKQKRLAERTVPFVGIFSGLVAVARIAADPPRTATDYAVLVGIIAVVVGFLMLAMRVITERENRALAQLAHLGMPFVMTCNVDIASFKRFGAFAGQLRLNAAVTRCAVATDGSTLHVAPGMRRHDGLGPQQFAVDISQAGPGTFGRNRSNWPALIIPVPFQGTTEPIYLTRQSWAKSGIQQSPLARLITDPIPA